MARDVANRGKYICRMNLGPAVQMAIDKKNR